MPGMAEHARTKHALKGWQAGLVATVVLLLTVALLAAAAASSYDNLWRLAVAHHVPFPRLNPVELDGGLVVTGLIDMVFTWSGYPLGTLRLLARLLGAGTIAANVAAGWPDPVGSFLRAFAPAIIVVITEAVRAFLLLRNPEVQDARKRKREERIPVMRWLLSPWPTFVLWRRMRLWDIGSYRAAVDMELSRRQAIVQLGMKFGSEWKRSAPADLVWMLKTGVRMPDALRRVRELTGLEPAAAPAVTGSGEAAVARKGTAATGRKRVTATGRKPASVTGSATAPGGMPAETAPADLDSEAKVLWYLAKGHSASKAGIYSGLTDSRGRQIARLAKTAPQDVVDGEKS